MCSIPTMSPVTVRKVALPQQPFMLHTTAPFQDTFEDDREFHQLIIRNVKSEAQHKAVLQFISDCGALVTREPSLRPQRGVVARRVVVRPDDFMLVDTESTREWYMLNDTDFATKDAWRALQGAPTTPDAPQHDRVLGTLMERGVAGKREASHFYRHYGLTRMPAAHFKPLRCSFPEFTPPEMSVLYLVWRDECVARACAGTGWSLEPFSRKVSAMEAGPAPPVSALFEAVDGKIFQLAGGLHVVTNMDIPPDTRVAFFGERDSKRWDVFLRPMFRYNLSALRVVSHHGVILRPGAGSPPPSLWFKPNASMLGTSNSKLVDDVLPASLRTCNPDGTYKIAEFMCDAPSLTVLHLVV